MVQTGEMKISAHEKSKLTGVLTSWLGSAPGAGFDTESLRGKGAMINIVEKDLTEGSNLCRHYIGNSSDGRNGSTGSTGIELYDTRRITCTGSTCSCPACTTGNYHCNSRSTSDSSAGTGTGTNSNVFTTFSERSVLNLVIHPHTQGSGRFFFKFFADHSPLPQDK